MIAQRPCERKPEHSPNCPAVLGCLSVLLLVTHTGWARDQEHGDSLELHHDAFLAQAIALHKMGKLQEVAPGNSVAPFIRSHISECVHCGADISKFRYLPVQHIDKLVCTNCGKVFPNNDYPDSEHRLVVAPTGKARYEPYYIRGKESASKKNPKTAKAGDRAYFRAATDRFRYAFFQEAMHRSAEAYQRTGNELYATICRELLVGYAKSLPHQTQGNSNTYDGFLDTGTWRTMQNYLLGHEHKSNAIPQSSFFPGRMGYYNSVATPRISGAYRTVFDSPVFHERVAGSELTAREFIQENFWAHLFRYGLNWGRQAVLHECNRGSGGAPLRHPAMWSQVPQFAHAMHQWVRWRAHNEAGYDSVIKQGGNYVEIIKSGVLAPVLFVEDYEDPKGFSLEEKDMPDFTYNNGPRAYSLQRGDGSVRINKGDFSWWKFPALATLTRHPLSRFKYMYRSEYANRLSAERSLPLRRNSTHPLPGHDPLSNQLAGRNWVALAEGGTELPGRDCMIRMNFTKKQNHFIGSMRLNIDLLADGRYLYKGNTQVSGPMGTPTGHSISSVPGMVESYVSHLPGMAMTTVNGSMANNNAFDGSADLKRTLIHNTVDMEHAYVVDIYECTGLDPNMRSFDYRIKGAKKLVLRCGGPGLKPRPYRGEPYVSVVKKASRGLDPTRWSGYALVIDTTSHQAGQVKSDEKGTWREISANKRKYTWVDWTFADSSDHQGARLHIVPDSKMKADPTIYTYEKKLLVSSRGGPGNRKYTTTKVQEHTFVYHQDVSRELGQKRTVMVFVHEPFKGNSRAITGVSRKTLAGGKGIAITVKLGNREDTYLYSFDGVQRMESGGLRAEAQFAAAVKEGYKRDLWLYAGTRAQSGNRTITAPKAVIEGALLETTRAEDRSPLGNSILMKGRLPAGAILRGQYVAIEFRGPRKELWSTEFHRIRDVKREGGDSRIHVDEDLGITKDRDGKWMDTHSHTWGMPPVTPPSHRYGGGGLGAIARGIEPKGVPKDDRDIDIKVVFRQAISSVPEVRLPTYQKSFYWTLGWMNDFVAVDKSNRYTLPLTTSHGRGMIHYTTDGSEPSQGSRSYTSPIPLKGDQTVKAIAANPRGVMVPRVQTRRYLNRLPAVDTNRLTLSGGLDWWGYVHVPENADKTLMDDYPFMRGIARARDVSSREYSTEGDSICRHLRFDVLKEGREVRRPDRLRMEGYLRVPASGLYDFGVYNSGKLYIDGVKVIDSYDLRNGVWEDKVALDKGYHRLRYEAYGIGKKARSRDTTRRLYWKGPGFHWKRVGKGDIFHVAPPLDENNGLAHEVYENIPGGKHADLNDSVFAKRPSRGSVANRPHVLSLGRNYAQRMRGLLTPPITGEYTFILQTRHGESANVYYGTEASGNDKTLLLKITEQTKALSRYNPISDVRQSLKLQGGEKYYLEIQHNAGDANGFLRLHWRYLNAKGERDGGVIAPRFLTLLPGQTFSPIPALEITKQFGPSPLRVSLDARRSSVERGKVVSYRWDFGDGQTATGGKAGHTFTRDGVYKVTLEVTGDKGTKSTTHRHVVVGNKGGINCGSPYGSSKGRDGVFFVEDTFQEDLLSANMEDTDKRGDLLSKSYVTPIEKHYQKQWGHNRMEGLRILGDLYYPVGVKSGVYDVVFRLDGANKGYTAAITAEGRRVRDLAPVRGSTLVVPAVLVKDEVLDLYISGKLKLSGIELRFVGRSLKRRSPGFVALKADAKIYAKGFTAPFKVYCDASESRGSIQSYEWDFGDGSSSQEANAVHTFEKMGVYPVKLTIRDKRGRTREASREVIVGRELTIHQSLSDPKRYLDPKDMPESDTWEISIDQPGEYWIYERGVPLSKPTRWKRGATAHVLSVDGKSYPLARGKEESGRHSEVLKLALTKGKHIIEMKPSLGWLGRDLLIYPGKLGYEPCKSALPTYDSKPSQAALGRDLSTVEGAYTVEAEAGVVSKSMETAVQK